MGDVDQQAEASETPVVSGPSRPSFGRKRKGFDPEEVRNYLDMIERERADLGAALVLTQARVRELDARLERYEAMEQELTRSVHLAKETAAAIIADAEARGEEQLASARRDAQRLETETRARLAEEEAALDSLRMALAAEAATLNEMERRSSVSRAAAALVELVDDPGGLGPFSQHTATLLEFAKLLHQSARDGSVAEVRLELQPTGPVATIVLPPDAAPSQPTGTEEAPVGHAEAAEGSAPAAAPAELPASTPQSPSIAAALARHVRPAH